MMPRARLRPLLPLTALALAVLGACSTSGSGAATTSGIVAGSYYRNALVCLDLDNNGRCDANEPSTRTDNNGAYSLSGPANAAVVAEITSDAVHYDPDTKTATTVTDPVVFRAPAQASAVVSAVSTELVALVEGGEDLATARSQLANRIGVSADVLLSDPNKVADASAKAALKNEIEQMTDRIAGAVAEAGAKGDLPKALCSHLALDIDLKKQIELNQIMGNTRLGVSFTQVGDGPFNSQAKTTTAKKSDWEAIADKFSALAAKLKSHVGREVILGLRPERITDVRHAHNGDASKADTQMYITLADTPRLNGKYVVFGKVISGMDVVDKLKYADRIVRLTVRAAK